MSASSPVTAFETVKLVLESLTPILIFGFGLFVNFKINKRYRKDIPHVEFDIECTIFGPHNGKYAAELTIYAENKGNVRHIFKNILLSVRGICKESQLNFRTKKDLEQRLEFPENLLEDKLVLEPVFVEPGIRQPIRYHTLIDENIKYIRIRAEFYYDKIKNQTKPHSAEKMFELPTAQ